MSRGLVVLLSLAAASAGCASLPAPQPAAIPADFTGYPDYRDRMPTALYRGINVGNALSAPAEGDWGWVLEEKHFDAIRRAGFDHVRVPVRFATHALREPPYTIDPHFLARVDWALDNVLARGMTAILDMHHDEELCRDPPAHRERFVAFWRQLAEHYRDWPEQLYLELLNEPVENLTPALWNEYLAEAYAIIRAAKPRRFVIIDAADWAKWSALEKLELPARDDRIIVSIHMYEPWEFCMQGETWLPHPPPVGRTWRGTEVERKQITDALDLAVRWSKAHGGVVLWNGEYGTYRRADLVSRVLWTRFVTREAEQRGIASALWSFHVADTAGIYDPASDRWVEPILTAVIPR